MDILGRYFFRNGAAKPPADNENELNTAKEKPEKKMARKLNLNHLSEEECERILNVIQRDFDIRQKEQERLGQIEEEIADVDKTNKLLGNQKNFNDNCCMRCFSTFFFIFNRKHQCYDCKYNVCKSCCDYNDAEQQYICKVCQRHRELSTQSCDWFYNNVKQKFKRFGSAKVVRSLYKRKLDSSESENDSGYDLSLYSSLPLARRHRQSVQGLFDQNSKLSKVKNGDKNGGESEQSRVGISGVGPDANGSDASDSEDVLKRERLSCTVPPAVLGNLSYRTFDEALQGAEMERSKLQLERIMGDLERNLANHTPIDDPSGDSNTQYDRILMKFKFQLSGVLSFMSQSLHSSSSNSYLSDPLMSPNSRHQQLRQVMTRHVEQIIGGPIDMSDETTSEYASEDGSNSDLHKAFEEVLADAIVKKIIEEHRKQHGHGYVHEEEVVRKELAQVSSQNSVVMQNLHSNTAPQSMLASQEEVMYENQTHQSIADQSAVDVKSGKASGVRSHVIKKRTIVSDRPSSESELSDIERRAGFRPVGSDTQTSDSDLSDVNKNSPNLHMSLEAGSSNEFDKSDSEFAQLAEQYEKVLNESPGLLNVSPRAYDVTKGHMTPVQAQELKELADLFNTSQSKRNHVAKEVFEEIEPASPESPVHEEVITKIEISRTDAMLPDLDDSFHGLEFVQSHEVSLPSFLEDIEVDGGSLGVDLDDIRRVTTSEDEISSGNEASVKGASPSNMYAEGSNWFFNNKKVISAYDNFGKKKVGRDMEGPVFMFVPKGEGSPTPLVGEKSVDELSEVSTCSLSDRSDTEDAVASAELQEITHQIVSTYSTSAKDAGKGTKVANQETDAQIEEQKLRQKSRELVEKGNSCQAVEKAQEILRKSPDYVDGAGKVVTRAVSMEVVEDDDPKFVQRPKNQDILRGETAVFDCKVCGTSPTDIFWYCDEDENIALLEDGDKYEVQSGTDRSQLTIHYTTQSDAGRYMCIAVNELGRCYCSFGLTLKENPMEQKSPEFLKEPQDVEVTEGQSAKFRCKVKGYPYPRVLWYKNGRRLINCDQYRMEKINNRDYSLSLDYVTLDDDAEYMVVAKNNLGEAKSSVQLIVEEKTKDGSSKLASLSGRVTKTREQISTTAEDMLQSADELSQIYKQLDEMNSSLTTMEDDVSSLTPNMDARNNNTDSSDQSPDSEDILREYHDQKTKAGAVRAVTTTALEVLMSAEDVIKAEKESLSEKRKWESPSHMLYQGQYQAGEEVHLTFQQFEKLYRSGLVTREELKARKVVLTREILEELDRMENVPESEDHDLLIEGEVPGVMDCGLKRVDSKRYKRDFVINNPDKKTQQRKWEVRTPSPLARSGLATMAPSMGRSGSMEEVLMDTEDQIYMTAGNLYSIEDSIRKLESHVQATDENTSSEYMSALEDEVARAVAKTELSDREIIALEKQTANLQKKVKSGSSSASSSHQGASGIKTHTSQSRLQSSPSPVLSLSENFSLRDSSSEYESFEDMPSVKKLMGMFNQSFSEEDQPFKRIRGKHEVHSLTARSLSKKARDLLQMQQKKNELESPVRMKSPPMIPEGREKGHSTPVSPLAKGSPVKGRAPTPPKASNTSTPISKQASMDDRKNLYSPVKTVPLSPIPQQTTTRKNVVPVSSSPIPKQSKRTPASASPTERRASPLSGMRGGKGMEKPKMRTPPPAEPPPKRSSTIMARAAFWDNKVTKGQRNIEFPDLPSETFKRDSS